MKSMKIEVSPAATQDFFKTISFVTIPKTVSVESRKREVWNLAATCCPSSNVER
jgi:hypothetical protein